MMFGAWHRARDNKESILNTIVTIFLLERVRTGWNRIESRGRREGRSREAIERRQNNLIVEAAFLYALPLLLPVVKYIYRSIEELSWSVQGLVVLKNTWAFFGIVVVTECLLAILIYNLLTIYVDRMNSALGFFTKIGRNIWDGSKTAVQVSGDMGNRVVGGARSVTVGVWRMTKSAARHSAKGLVSLGTLTRRGRPMPKRVGEV